MAPPPGPDDRDWAHWWTELLLAQGISHWRLGDPAAAAASFDRVLAVSPWPDSQNVRAARWWLGMCKEGASGLAVAEAAGTGPERPGGDARGGAR